MTISIVARQATTGQLGVATASLGVAVGAWVPHLRAGVGAAAVQAGSPVAWGEEILDLLESGESAREVCERLKSMPGAEAAQVGIVDRHEGVAVLSGSTLEAEAGDARGAGVCAVANLMERPDVPQAALAAYLTSAALTLSGCLLDGLVAADRLGGDVRGRQSASVRVVSGAGLRVEPVVGVDLRVDDARRPVDELGRLHRVWEAQELLRASRGPDGLYRDVERALAAVAIAPEDQMCLAGAAFALLRADRVPDAMPLIERLVRMEPRTPQRIQRLMDGGQLDPRVGQNALAKLHR